MVGYPGVVDTATDRTTGDDPTGAGEVPRHPVEVTITVCPDGPLLVRGPAAILGAAGGAVPRRRGTVALCRCGRSALAPYCDGSHKAVGRSGPG